MSETATRYRALCCGCGTLRTVDHNYHGLPQHRHLSERRTSEPYWRGLRSLKCKTCKAWTRHALIFDGADFDADGDERHDHRQWATSSLDGVFTVDALVAELARRDIAVAWAERMRWVVLWLPDQRVMVLNAQHDASELRDEVAASLDSEAWG